MIKQNERNETSSNLSPKIEYLDIPPEHTHFLEYLYIRSTLTKPSTHETLPYYTDL